MTDEAMKIQAIETKLLLSAVMMRYGYDFTDYQHDSMEHRVRRFIDDNQFHTGSQAIEAILREQSVFHRLLPYLSVSVTSLYRDPHFYKQLLDNVFPLLRTWPRIKIWHAGCATGEEVYSLAILLDEAGLLERTTIYATDINTAALETAKSGIYGLSVLKSGSGRYRKSGGKCSLSDYYRAENNSAIITRRIREKVTFARHNLAMDASFGDMNLILCRNVLIYFKDILKDRVLNMFQSSLEYGGYLALGHTESLCFSSVEKNFKAIDDDARIYKNRLLTDE